MMVDSGITQLLWKQAYVYTYPDLNTLEKLPDWLRNFKTNYDTIGFDRTIEDLPKIDDSSAVIVVDHPMTGSIEKHLAHLTDFSGVLMVCDRALYKVLPFCTPEYTCNLDSSYLCMSFFDRPDVRKVMDKVTAIFATTTFPLTIRHWQGKRVFFTPYMGGLSLSESLSAISRTPWMHTGGNVASFLWLLAVNLGAKDIGLLGFDFCVNQIDQTEYPNVVHDKITKDFSDRPLPKEVWIDPVYKRYAEILHFYIRTARKEMDVRTINLQPDQGVLHSKFIEDMSIEAFLSGK